MESMSSRDRMLAAIAREKPDHIPCAFMIFTALRGECESQVEYLGRQLELGLDAVVEVPYRGSSPSDLAADVPGLPVTVPPGVAVKRWVEEKEGRTILVKSYETPHGTLSTSVAKTRDWPHGDEVPIFDDYLIPRSEKFLVAGPKDLVPLRDLLRPPSPEELSAFREEAARMKRFAAERGLLTASGWGVGLEAGCWLCGIENLILAAMDDPGFVAELVALLGEWNRTRMEAVLDVGIDLFIRRGWYESTDFWSPDLFEQFVMPSLTAEARLAHEAGARFGYIMTSGVMPLADLVAAAGVDVLIGVDPVQGKGTDMRLLKGRLGRRVALWGGVNGFLTVELGSEAEVEAAVEAAIGILGPEGFILSPVDNVRESTPAVWRNVRALVRAWQRLR